MNDIRLNLVLTLNTYLQIYIMWICWSLFMSNVSESCSDLTNFLNQISKKINWFFIFDK